MAFSLSVNKLIRSRICKCNGLADAPRINNTVGGLRHTIAYRALSIQTRGVQGHPARSEFYECVIPFFKLHAEHS